MPRAATGAGEQDARGRRCWARLVQIFWPVTRQPPSPWWPVRSEARSEPASGSENSWHQISSPVRIGSRKRSFWARRAEVDDGRAGEILADGVEPLRRAGPVDLLGEDRRALASAPRPPYSFGQDRPA